MKLPPRRESDLTREVLRFLNRIPGVVAWRTNVGAVSADHKGRRRFVRFGFPGLSDIIGWKEENFAILDRQTDISTWTHSAKKARFLAIEVKSARGQLTPQQQGFLDLVNKAGGIGFVCRRCEDVAERFGIKP